MSEAKKKLSLTQLCNVMGQLYPLRLAASWDNVGLLVECSGNPTIERVTMTIDLTEKVLEEAIQNKSQLIIAYHPPIFVPLKRLTQSSVKERIIVKCLENHISVYSPHSAWDAVHGGINDWIAAGLKSIVELKSNTPLEPAVNEGRFRITAAHTKKESSSEDYKTLVQRLTQLHIADLNTSSSSSSSTSTSAFASSCADISFTCPERSLSACYEALQNAHYTDVQSVALYSPPDTANGQGRLVTFAKDVELSTLVQHTKKFFNLQHVRVAPPESAYHEFSSCSHSSSSSIPSSSSTTISIRTVAVCAGSGGSLFGKVKADCFLTGEMSHHDILAATAKGSSVILCEHTNCERGYLSVFVEKLKQEVGIGANIEFSVSKTDHDPICIV
eukprot:TRINITY_DN4879_c0_g1_i1.p1 TRINITY_DN4879_c0_g1~~TRINITY_DN4879_c0_g1_i1.p1  ORF type:complete len:400 (+),score=69.94 TRINITY_DN4879_c0_g1_i1:41-1201(+)